MHSEDAPDPAEPPQGTVAPTVPDLLEAEGRREQKKRETRQALNRNAIDLVLRHGLAGVTTDDIARATGVSPRTFFNYFPTKEAALAGVPETIVEKVSWLVAERPADESPWTTARMVAERLLWIATHDAALWRARRALMAARPEVAALMQGSQHALENGLLEAMVARAEASAHPVAPWRAQMMALTCLDAVRVATQLGDDPDEASRLLREVLDAHDVVHG